MLGSMFRVQQVEKLDIIARITLDQAGWMDR